jgi:hypothetical protein
MTRWAVKAKYSVSGENLVDERRAMTRSAVHSPDQWRTVLFDVVSLLGPACQAEERERVSELTLDQLFTKWRAQQPVRLGFRSK